jgi:hypothetical protein
VFESGVKTNLYTAHGSNFDSMALEYLGKPMPENLFLKFIATGTVVN